MTSSNDADRGRSPPFAVILGTNEIASAVAVELNRSGYTVVMSHDPLPPVIRRKMAFHDALFDDAVSVDGLTASRADTGIDIRAALTREASVIVTELGLLDLIVVQTPQILIDARMQKYLATPDLRRLGRLTVGLGPGFASSINCDVAIETRPGKAGRIIPHGFTAAPDGVAQRLGSHQSDRFVRAEFSGRWHTAVEIGTRIFKDYVVGHLGSSPVRAPFDGILRGLVRDGTEVPAGAKLLELDPRGRKASCTQLDSRARHIARAVAKAVPRYMADASTKPARVLHLVK